MSRRLRRALTVLGALCAAVAPGPAHAVDPPSYTVTPIIEDRFGISVATAVNDAGVVAAHEPIDLDDFGVGRQPFLFADGVRTDLPLASDLTGDVAALNDDGDAAGTELTDLSVGNPVPVAWIDGAVRPLRALTPQSFLGEAFDINNRGVIVGGADPDGSEQLKHAVLWPSPSAAPIDLGTLPGDTGSVAAGINDRGVVVGSSTSAAVIWRDGDPTALPGGRGHAADINDSGVVVGSSFGPAGGGAAVWHRGTMELLPVGPRTSSSQADAVNAAGDIVGGEHTMTDSIAVLWRDGRRYPLDSLLDRAAGWHVVHAFDISDTGYIAADAVRDGRRYGVLLAPAARAPSCAGRPATIVGTPGADTIAGTAGPDVIVAAGGDDRIRGHGRRDVVCAGPGDDWISGGGARDRLLGGAGADEIHAEQGDDLLVAGAGPDTLHGDRGRDRLRGGPGRDRCIGGRDLDTASACERVRSVP